MSSSAVSRQLSPNALLEGAKQLKFLLHFNRPHTFTSLPTIVCLTVLRLQTRNQGVCLIFVTCKVYGGARIPTAAWTALQHDLKRPFPLLLHFLKTGRDMWIKICSFLLLLTTQFQITSWESHIARQPSLYHTHMKYKKKKSPTSIVFTLFHFLSQ